MPFPFQVPAEEIGATDLSGEISVPARTTFGFYVVAPGHALFVGRLAPCANDDGCLQQVQLTRPIPFPGIRVRDAEGAPESAAWLVFLKDGIPIPVSIQNAVIEANHANPGLLILHEGTDSIHMLPGLFGPGIYEVEYVLATPGAAPERIPLGQFSLPASHRIELTLPRGVKVQQTPAAGR